MYKIENRSKRNFIVVKKDLIKGGQRTADDNRFLIGPGDIVEVSDEFGKIMETYPREIKIIEKPDAKEVVPPVAPPVNEPPVPPVLHPDLAGDAAKNDANQTKE